MDTFPGSASDFLCNG